MAVGTTQGVDLPGVPPTLKASPKDRQPDNPNYLNPTYFRFFLNRVPAVTYFCQAVNLPGISIEPIDQDTFFANAKHIGSKASFDELSLRFVVDEDLQNWREIHDWIRSISNAEDFHDYIQPEADHVSDAVLTILTSGMNANLEVVFKNCFPTSLGGIEFDSAVTDMDSITSEISLSYDSYEIRKL